MKSVFIPPLPPVLVLRLSVQCCAVQVTLDPGYASMTRQSREALEQRSRETAIKQLPDKLA